VLLEKASSPVVDLSCKCHSWERVVVEAAGVLGTVWLRAGRDVVGVVLMRKEMEAGVGFFFVLLEVAAVS